jgi:membrane protease YdiL (CAAX protease family)
MAFEPLEKGRYWLLLVWLPYWILNIFGEEFLWRGVILPRQEAALGKYAWLFHGSGWGLFHIAFGWQLLVTLLPLIFIQSFVVHQTRTFCPGSPPGRPPNARLIIGIRFLSIQILVPPSL